MRTILLQIGKTTEAYLETGIAHYAERLKHYCDFELITLPGQKTTSSMDEATQKERDSNALINALQPSDDVILLDERGKEMNSVEFASFMQKRMNASPKRMVFVIGGAYGFSKTLYSRANAMVSLSRMTLSHQMVRLFAIEQLYRAHTIIRGEKYHH